MDHEEGVHGRGGGLYDGDEDDDDCRVDGVDAALRGVFSEFANHVFGQRRVHVSKYHPYIDGQETQNEVPSKVRTLPCVRQNFVG